MFKKFSALITVALMATGCVHVPDKLQISEGAVLTNFTDVKGNGEATVGQQARWGGVIADIKITKTIP